MGYSPKLVVQYGLRYKKLFHLSDVRLENLENYFERWWDFSGRSKKREPRGKEYYKTISDEPKRLQNVLGLLRKTGTLIESGEEPLLSYDLVSDSLLAQDYQAVKDLANLDFITYPSIRLEKDMRKFELAGSSSGEYHFICTMLALISVIEDDCLIIIDEPEISLHPNWQSKYMELIQGIFRPYGGCHFLIASHSHFMVSGLPGESSTIIKMLREQAFQASLVPRNTFGWSAEQILLDVFSMPTTRNYYVAERIGEVLEMISLSDRDDEKIRRKVEELRDLNLDDLSVEDPLRDVVTRLFEKY